MIKYLAGGLAALVATAIATLVVATLPGNDKGPSADLDPIPAFPNVNNEPRDVLWIVERPHQMIGILLAALVVLITSGTNIDGGAVLGAVYILVLKLGPDEAIPLSSATIFGGAFCDFLLNLWKKTIYSNNSLVNWDFILLMQPMLLMGAGVGASLTSSFPTWLLLVALIVYLAHLGKKLFGKTRTICHQEGWRSCGSGESVSLLGAPTISFQDDESGFEYRSGLPFRKLGINVGLFVTTLLLTALPGGKYLPSPLGIPRTPILFFLVLLLPVIFLSVVSHYQLKDVLTTYHTQQNPRFILVPNEVQWSPDSIKQLPLRLLGIGAIGGAFGVGGKGATSRLLRGVNMTPAAASAMSATTAFFISGMASFDFYLWGKLDLIWAKYLMPLGFVMTLFGRLGLARIVRSAKSRTLLLFAITAAMFISIFPLSFMVLQSLK